jgi:hypothetical protein
MDTPRQDAIRPSTSAPNKSLELTASSRRSCLAPASGQQLRPGIDDTPHLQEQTTGLQGGIGIQSKTFRYEVEPLPGLARTRCYYHSRAGLSDGSAVGMEAEALAEYVGPHPGRCAPHVPTGHDVLVCHLEIEPKPNIGE